LEAIEPNAGDRQTGNSDCLVSSKGLRPGINSVPNRFGASVAAHFNGRVTLALNVGGVESKRKTSYTEKRQLYQHNE
jgi:hypothetical protein